MGRFGVRINVLFIELFLIGNGLLVDYEKYVMYNIMFLCSDSGGLFYERDFVIWVLDVNDFLLNVIFIDFLGDIILSLNFLVNVLDIKFLI